jgi:hypothetical protein
MSCCGGLELSHEIPCSDIYLEQGAQWRQTFQLKDASGSVVNLTDCLITGDVRRTKATAVIFSFTFSINEENNTFTATIPHGTTAGLTIGLNIKDPMSQFEFDWTLRDSQNEQHKIHKGRILINKEVTVS